MVAVWRVTDSGASAALSAHTRLMAAPNGSLMARADLAPYYAERRYYRPFTANGKWTRELILVLPWSLNRMPEKDACAWARKTIARIDAERIRDIAQARREAEAHEIWREHTRRQMNSELRGPHALIVLPWWKRLFRKRPSHAKCHEFYNPLPKI